MAEEPDLWYLMIEKVREGPLSKQDIQYLLSQKQVDGTTMAWRKGMDTWHRLRDLEEFRPNRPNDPPEDQPVQKEALPTVDPSPARLASLGLLPKLAAVLISLGLTAGGIYWTVLRVPPQPDAIPATHPEIPGLLARLGQNDSVAEQALAELGSQSVRPLMELLQELPENPPETIKRVLVAIGPTGISNLSSFLNPETTGVPVRIYVIQILGDIGGMQTIPSLVQVLGDPSQLVQTEAVQTLAALGPQATPSLINQLQNPVQNTPPAARRNLVKAIQQHADPSMAPALERARSVEQDTEVKQALGEVLGQLADIKSQLSNTSRPPGVEQPITPLARVVQASQAPRSQPIDVRVHASAEAKATITDEREKDPPKAAKEAEKGEAHRNEQTKSPRGLQKCPRPQPSADVFAHHH